jgi:hypothetical protein
MSHEELRKHKKYLLDILEAQLAHCRFCAWKYKNTDEGFYKEEVEHLELIINLIKKWEK